MVDKFIYAFDVDTRDKLLSRGCKLIKSDERRNIFVFENKEQCTFEANSFAVVFSNTITF